MLPLRNLNGARRRARNVKTDRTGPRRAPQRAGFGRRADFGRKLFTTASCVST